MTCPAIGELNPRSKDQVAYAAKFAKYPEVKLLKNARNRRRVVERSITIWTKRLADWHAELSALDREIEDLKPAVRAIRCAERKVVYNGLSPRALEEK